jgi:hypothetical protein
MKLIGLLFCAFLVAFVWHIDPEFGALARMAICALVMIGLMIKAWPPLGLVVIAGAAWGAYHHGWLRNPFDRFVVPQAQNDASKWPDGYVQVGLKDCVTLVPVEGDPFSADNPANPDPTAPSTRWCKKSAWDNDTPVPQPHGH